MCWVSILVVLIQCEGDSEPSPERSQAAAAAATAEHRRLESVFILENLFVPQRPSSPSVASFLSSFWFPHFFILYPQPYLLLFFDLVPSFVTLLCYLICVFLTVVGFFHTVVLFCRFTHFLKIDFVQNPFISLNLPFPLALIFYFHHNYFVLNLFLLRFYLPHVSPISAVVLMSRLWSKRRLLLTLH